MYGTETYNLRSLLLQEKIFHQSMIEFINRLYLNDQKYQTNRTVTYENYKGKFVFPMK